MNESLAVHHEHNFHLRLRAMADIIEYVSGVTVSDLTAKRAVDGPSNTIKLCEQRGRSGAASAESELLSSPLLASIHAQSCLRFK